MASAWEFPTSLNVGGIDYEIRTDYRAVLDLLAALNDKDLEDEDKRIEAYMKSRVVLEIMFLGSFFFLETKKEYKSTEIILWYIPYIQLKKILQ